MPSSALEESLVARQPASRRSRARVQTGTSQPRQARRKDVFEQRYGYSWDLCMVFPTEPPVGTPTADSIVRKLTNAGLETYLYLSVQEDEIICKIRAPLERLSRYAADVEYTMLLDEGRVKRAMEEGSHDPPIAGRHITHDPTITTYRPHEYIYGKYGTSARLTNMYACPPYLEHPFSSAHRIKLIRRIIEGTRGDGCGMNVVALERQKAVKAFFPFHDDERRRKVFALWVQRYANPGNQPVDLVKDYLGEKIALYFALLGHYTAWLGWLSIAGVVMAINQIMQLNIDAMLAPYFAIFVSFWAILMLEYWKRAEAKYAMKWGMSEYEAIEHDRAQFKGDTMISFINGSPMTYYPPEEYVQLMVCANTLVIAMLALTVGFVAGIFVLEWSWTTSSNELLEKAGSYLASFLLSLEIQIMNFVYKKVAVWTTERENHRTDTVFEDTLIAKLAVFQFVNSYASLFYIAFVSPFTDAGCSYDNCLLSLCVSLGIIFCTRLIVANSLEIYYPRWLQRKRIKEEREGVPDDALFTEAEVQYTWSTYDEMMGPLSDMSEISIQFGYVTLFVVAFPLAPALAYVSNYVEIRIDALRIMYEVRRPFPRGAQDIGTWQLVWTCTAYIAVATNAGLIFFTADQLDWQQANLVWGFAIWQYIVFILMAIFMLLVPDVPNDVSIQLGRQKFITSKIIDQVPDDTIPISSLRHVPEGERVLDIKGGDDRPPPPPHRLPRFSWF